MKFRRRRSEDEEPLDVPELADEFDELETDRPRGPWDRTETRVDEEDEGYVDLGGLVVKGVEGLELRLQIDEASSMVAAVLLAGPTSGLELRAFAAPTSGGIWDEVRADIAAEAGRHGGTATEQDGEFGTELKVIVQVQTPDGQHGTQTSRIVGVEGPRWLLRGTFLGQSAEEADPGGPVESAFRDVIVVRGDEPMSPREMLPMRMPLDAQQLVAEQLQAQAGEAGSDGYDDDDPDED
ncbi:MAG: DUF3710 domain-containing protein [Nocardioidaceae bacterium]